MQIICYIDKINMLNGNGKDVAGVTATCSRCNHTTKSFGTGEASRKRCLVLLREECPLGEKNFYVEEM
jgi:hypothetical protein